MHDVPDIQAIRVMKQRGMSRREIAKRLHVSRKTVDKYTAADYVVPVEARMRLQQPRAAPKMAEWKPILEAWITQDAEEPRKQRRTAHKLYRDLKTAYGERVQVAEVTVRRFVAQVKGKRAQEAFVPLEFEPGAMGEVDFGHADVVLAGQRQRLPFFAIALMYSSVRFVKVYPHEQLESVLDGMASGLSHVGGVARQFMFDNATTIVRDILGGGRRVQTPEFKALQAHYGFEAVFANPASGNEKGGVENLVQWAQRNLFSPAPEADTLDELNARLAEQCLADARRRQRTAGGPLVAELWEKEQAHLGTLPAEPFPACRHRFARVTSLLLVQWDGVRYSAPAKYAGKSLLLRVFFDRVELTDQGRVVAVHARQPRGGCSLQLSHYLPVLEHKPRAVAHAAVIARGAPEIARYRDEFLAARPEDHRELVEILRLGNDVGLDRLTVALATASRHRAYDLESVRAVLAMDAPTDATPAALAAAHLARWPEAVVEPVSSAAYAWLTDGSAGGAAR